MSSTLISICGGSGAGKSTVACAIVDSLDGDGVALIHQDSYYKDLSAMDQGEREAVNFDHPGSVDMELLCSHMESLKEGRSVEKPLYDFETHTRSSDTERIEPRRVVLLEGIHVLWDPALRALADIKIFVDTDPDLRFLRRLKRDVEKRGRSTESVIEQYISTVRPMHLEFVEQSKVHADVIIPTTRDSGIAVAMIAARIEELFEE